jgi:hypothetical protein
MSALSLTAASIIRGTGSQINASYTIGSGVNVTAGEVLYLDTTASPNVLRLAIATGTLLQATVFGIALTGGSAGQPCIVDTSDSALTIGSATVTAGATVYLGATAGQMTVTLADLTTGNYIAQIGQITGTTTVMNFSVTVPPVVHP